MSKSSVKLPTPQSEVDRTSFESVYSVPWLRDSIASTGQNWGRRIADVKMSRLPQNLLGLTMLIPSDAKHPDSSPPLDDEVRIVIYRWDRYDHLGWDKPFTITLTFPGEHVYEVEIPQSSKLIDRHSVRVPVDHGTTIVRERVQQINRSIPRIVYNLSVPLNKQLSQPVRRLLKNVRRMTDLIQCTCLYLIIEDEAGRREVESSGIPNFVEAYNALRSGSYKADLVRYYLLYKYGGVYLDDKTFLRHSLDSSAFDYIFSGSEDRPCEMFIGMAGTSEIAFMSSRRGSPLMLKALETAIDNVMKRFYGTHRLGITGNHMFNKIFLEHPAQQQDHRQPGTSPEINERWGQYLGEKVAFLPITRSDERIIWGDDILWQRQAIPSADWPKPPTYYANLWNDRMVYTDGNPERSSMSRMLSMTAETRREVIAYSLTLFAVLIVGFMLTRYPPISWI